MQRPVQDRVVQGHAVARGRPDTANRREGAAQHRAAIGKTCVFDQRGEGLDRRQCALLIPDHGSVLLDLATEHELLEVILDLCHWP